MWLYFRLFLLAIQLLGRTRRDLLLENLVLRQQLAIYERVPRRPPLRAADRRFWSTLSRHWHPWRHHLVVVQPATVVRWHRTAWRRYWRWQSRGRALGRPPLEAETVALIRRLVRENPIWGTRRIQGELRQLGLIVSRATIQRYRGPLSSPSPNWRTFLRLHAPEIWAADFFTVQTLTFRTVYVFFCLSHDRRRVIHWNVTAHPTGVWVWNQIIAATPWGRQPRYLLRDRDARYGGNFVARARGIGIETLLTPFRAPQANAIAERFVRTVRRECLDHVIVWDERHLRRVLREYVAFYNAVRPHQALAQDPPAGARRLLRPVGASRIVSEPVLGGLHHVYSWAAA